MSLLRIRPEQLDVFRDSARAEFEAKLVAHLRKFFPGACAALGEAATRDAVGHGLARAETWRLTTERDLCKYIDVMFAYGRDFDADPRLPWAMGALSEALPASERIERLFGAALSHAAQAHGYVPDENADAYDAA